MYAGTEDQIVPFQDAVNYYERVIKTQHGLKQTQEFFRFFMVPGMGHCGGGPGLGDFGQGLQDTVHDVLTAMINWVENRIAPNKFIAKGYDNVHKVPFQRPIYPYPMFPNYIGGDPNSPLSYQGINHKRGDVLKPAQIYLK